MSNSARNNIVIQKGYDYLLSTVENRLEKTGLLMEATAKDHLKDADLYATGQIVKGIKAKVTKGGGKISLEFGCYAKSATGYPYPAVVEFGRRPGLRPPPSSVIEEWLHQKMRTGHIYVVDTGILSKTRKKTRVGRLLKAKQVMATNNTRGLAYVIARAIGANGQKERPFMRPAFEKGVKAFYESV